MFNILIIIFMKRKKLFVLPCIATMAIASILGIDVVCSQPGVSELTVDNLEALSQTESAGECKWKIVDCDGWFSGNYEACLENGDGNSCTCGQVTREC